MVEYHVIPSNPRYEINRDSQIRSVDGQEPVLIYAGRASAEQPLHPRVRLRDHRDYPIAVAVEDLMVEVFPDYERPEKPAPVETAVPKMRKQSADRDLRLSKGVYIKDASKEWRPVPGYSRYEMAADGSLWSAYRQKNMVMGTQKNGVKSYHVYSDTGRKTTKTVQALLDLAFPENAKPKPVKEPKVRVRPPYRKAENWRDIPGFERYQVSRDGALRYKSNNQIMRNIEDGKVKLVQTFDVEDLVELAFGEEAA